MKSDQKTNCLICIMDCFIFDEQEYGKAKDIYDKVIELYPDFGQAYYERARAWYGIGVLNMTCKDLDKAEALGFAQATEGKKQLCK